MNTTWEAVIAPDTFLLMTSGSYQCTLLTRSNGCGVLPAFSHLTVRFPGTKQESSRPGLRPPVPHRSLFPRLIDAELWSNSSITRFGMWHAKRLTDRMQSPTPWPKELRREGTPTPSHRHLSNGAQIRSQTEKSAGEIGDLCPLNLITRRTKRALTYFTLPIQRYQCLQRSR